MKVKALKAFSGPKGSYGTGDIFELPNGVNWIKEGLVEVVEPKRTRRRKQAEPKK